VNKGANEVMINHGSLFNDRLNTEFILTVSLYLPSFTSFLCAFLVSLSKTSRRFREMKFSFSHRRQLRRHFLIIKIFPGAHLL
jgi:hypothetical protein